MTTSITILICSLLILLTLFILKAKALSGRSNVLTHINQILEPYVLSGMSVVRTVSDHLEPKRFKVVFLYSLVHSLNWVLSHLKRIVQATHHKFTALAEAMQGREAILKGGASSVFLKSIAEHKKKIQEDRTQSIEHRA